MSSPTPRHPHVLDPAIAAVVVVDLQEGFRAHIHQFDRIVARTAIVVQSARLLNIPVLATEQYPQRLGATVPEIRAILPPDVAVGDKTAFSSCGCESFMTQLKRFSTVKQVLLCGIETHVCMNQTAHDLLAEGYQVHVLFDCTSSRRPEDREVGLAKMQRSGVLPSSSEMALFELMRDAKHEQFKAIQKLIK
jgi:nicotinamidase-related amidase